MLLLQEYKIRELKRAVYEKTGIAPIDQRLLFGPKQLEEMRNGQSMKISDYEITDNSTIVLVVRLVGGKCNKRIKQQIQDTN